MDRGGDVDHLYHSVIFGLLFAAGCQVVDIERYVSSVPQAALIGLGWGVVLWFVAAGFVMPAWLLAIGEPATLPTLDVAGLVAHILWGVTLGVSYSLLDNSSVFKRFTDRLVDSVISPQ